MNKLKSIYAKTGRIKGEGTRTGKGVKKYLNTGLLSTLRNFCIEKFPDFVAAFDSLDDKEKAVIYSKVVAIVLPKSVNIEGEVVHRSIQILDAKALDITPKKSRLMIGLQKSNGKEPQKVIPELPES